MSTKNSKTAHRPTYNKLLSVADGAFRIVWLQQRTLTIKGNGVPTTISTNHATTAPSHSTDASVRSGRKTTGGERAVIGNEYQTPDGQVAEGERCFLDDRSTRPVPAASKKFVAHDPRNCRNPDVNNDKVQTREYTVK